jgi:predicted nucleic acid-binding protein
MAELLLDTDVFVDHLRGVRRLDPGGEAFYSVVTRAELFAGRRADEVALRRLLAPFAEVPVDRGVAELGGRVRREAAIALPDALIAATALRHGLTLLTRNRRHYGRVPRLRLRSPA